MIIEDEMVGYHPDDDCETITMTTELNITEKRRTVVSHSSPRHFRICSSSTSSLRLRFPSLLTAGSPTRIVYGTSDEPPFEVNVRPANAVQHCHFMRAAKSSSEMGVSARRMIRYRWMYWPYFADPVFTLACLISMPAIKREVCCRWTYAETSDGVLRKCKGNEYTT